MAKFKKLFFEKTNEKISELHTFKVTRGETTRLALVATIAKNCARIHGEILPHHNIEIIYLDELKEPVLEEPEIVYYNPAQTKMGCELIS